MLSACLSLILAAVILSISCFLQLSYESPILGPDLSQCSPVSASSDTITLKFNCCLPVPTKKIVDFSFQTYPPVKRHRAPAHKASEEYIKKLNKAYELMKSLPVDDPRSFAKQADIHCAFCSGAYKQPGNNITLQVHLSWLFLPWHRWYLYFHERILAKLIDDPSFALVFWNWDNQKQGNVLPADFLKNGTAIYDPKRDQLHLPPVVIALNSFSNATSTKAIIEQNLNAMYQAMVTASTAELFMGGEYRAGVDDSNTLGGSMENSIHGAVHFWTADKNQTFSQDMGFFPTAARDPIFFAHHSNVDRLWDVWKTLPGGRRRDHTDPDFLNTEFLFYDEDANLVKVKVRDALDNKNLGIHYKKVNTDKLWIHYNPQAVSRVQAKTISSSVDSREIGSSLVESATKSIEIGEKTNIVVRLPGKPSAALLKAKGVKKAEDLVQVLVMKEVELTRKTFVQLLVFVNLPDADANTKIDTAEYVGTVNVIPTSTQLLTNVKLEIGDNLKRIGIQDSENVMITILTKSHIHRVSAYIKGLNIHYE